MQLHLQTRGAHVEDALSEHVAHFVPTEVAAPHALQAGGVCVRFRLAEGSERDEAPHHVPAPPPLQNERGIPDNGTLLEPHDCAFKILYKMGIEGPLLPLQIFKHAPAAPVAAPAALQQQHAHALLLVQLQAGNVRAAHVSSHNSL